LLNSTKVATAGLINELLLSVVSSHVADRGYPFGVFEERNIGVVDNVYLVSYPRVHIPCVFVMPSVRKTGLCV